MSRFDADYFDGRTSRLHRVEVAVEGGRALVRGPDVELEYAATELSVQPRLGSTPFRIDLPNGGLLVTQAAVGGILAVPRVRGLAHRLESGWGFIAMALIGLAVFAGLAHQYAIPALARAVAFRIPADIEAQLADEGMEVLDRHLFKPSKLSAERQETLRHLFGQMTTAGVVPARIEFRDGGAIGANAFALPGGVVVMTDQLEALLKNDEQIAAVLAHEVGHLEHRHGSRHILQDSIITLLVAAVVGDVSAVSTLVGTLPVVLSHTSNSRIFEQEADEFAFKVLLKTGRSPRLLGDALTALENEHRNVPDLGYLSTHPPTRRRIEAAEAAAK